MWLEGVICKVALLKFLFIHYLPVDCLFLKLNSFLVIRSVSSGDNY